MPNIEPLSGLVLASASPRRRQILEELLGSDAFSVVVPRLDESSVPVNRRTARYVRAVSEAKCSALLEQHPFGDVLVLSADTIVVRGGRILGKPADEREARDMLRHLSGSWHVVRTAVTAAVRFSGTTRMHTETACTQVLFRKLDPALCDWYIRTREWTDKAGAYGIQGFGRMLVSRIRGPYDNVVGLPVVQAFSAVETVLRQTPDAFSFHLPWFDSEKMEEKNGNDTADLGHAPNTKTL